MIPIHRPYIISCILILFAVSFARAEVLLLKNGSLLEGEIRRTRDSYVVHRSQSHVYARAEDVLFRGEDLCHVYDWKFARTDPHDVQKHVLLAQWCLSHGLTSEAKERIDYIANIDPRHSAIEVLRKQLGQSTQRDQLAEPAVQQVSFQRASDTAADANVDPDVLRQFTKTIQPLLLNRCGATACHGRAGTSSFTIVRPIYGNTRREHTLRNLAETLSLVNQSDPNASRLFQFGMSAHGPCKSPPIAVADEAKVKLLREWVATCSEHQQGSEQESRGEDVESTEPNDAEQINNPETKATKNPFDRQRFNASSLQESN